MVRKDIKQFIQTIPSDVTVVAASKYVDTTDMKHLIDAGIFDFGENRVDSFLNKYDNLKNLPIKWHFIGHLQRNKAKDIINKIDFLDSLDSLKLAELIQTARLTPLKCLVEVSINLEENKNGVPYFELESFLKELKQYSNIQIVGLMMMTIRNSDEQSMRNQFKELRLLRDEMEKKLDIRLPYLSMGMSEDYLEAIKEGATHIRLGRILFDLL